MACQSAKVKRFPGVVGEKMLRVEMPRSRLQLTYRQLVLLYIDRIEAYDKKGPALNAIIMVNPNALAVADALDAKYAQSGFAGPLHCVPVIVKEFQHGGHADLGRLAVVEGIDAAQ